MGNIQIGLYKHKETGQYDVMIDCIDNTMKVHNGEFEKIKTFTHNEKTQKDLLREECKDLLKLIKNNVDDFLIPVLQGETSDSLDDKKINLLRENLYDFMCVRRKLLEVNEFSFK